MPEIKTSPSETYILDMNKMPVARLYNAGKIKGKTFDNMDDLEKNLKSRP